MKPTPKQMETVKEWARDFSLKCTAARLGLPFTTVADRLARARARLGLPSLYHLAVWTATGMACLMVMFAGVPTGPTAVTLGWDAQAGADRFFVYGTNNAAAPMPWPVVTNAPGNATNVTITMQPGAMFFYLTASNFWGESGPSNVASTPPVPSGQTNLTIRRAL